MTYILYSPRGLYKLKLKLKLIGVSDGFYLPYTINF